MEGFPTIGFTVLALLRFWHALPGSSQWLFVEITYKIDSRSREAGRTATTIWRSLRQRQRQTGGRKRLYVVRRVNQDQAAVIREIFETYASGFGLTRTAKILEIVSSAKRATSMDARRVKANLKSRLLHTKALLSRHLPETLQMLQKLLVKRLSFTPVNVNGRKGYRFAGAGSYGGLLDGEAHARDP